MTSIRAARRHRVAIALATVVALGGCANLPSPPPPAADATVAPAWQAPLPHGGTSAGLADWWRQFDDPLLDTLIVAAGAASPTLASAAARIEEARANRVAATSLLLPQLDARADASRSSQQASLAPGITESANAGLQASWELDLFGRGRAGLRAAEARSLGAEAGWHEARVAVAAETAARYVALRACEARLLQVREDARSRDETLRLTELSTRAGFESRANAALARATAAQGRALLTQQAEQCDRDVKSLVALTALAEPDLRSRLTARTAALPQPAAIVVPSVPAAALAQRPDVRARDRDVAAASADVAAAEAARLPSVSLAGSVGVGRYEFAGFSESGTSWSIGPVSVSLPLFDAGRRRVDVRAARARYDEAASRYAATLRDAIREVESALVGLQSTAERQPDAQLAADNFEASYEGVEARRKSGFASLFELEDARRSLLASQIDLIELRRQRVSAWIDLYRALGGGWSADDGTAERATAAAAAAATPPASAGPGAPS